MVQKLNIREVGWAFQSFHATTKIQIGGQVSQKLSLYYFLIDREKNEGIEKGKTT